MKKMTNQVKAMVEATNERMREYHIKDSSDSVFNTVCWLLTKAGCYHGFNYYTEEGKLSGGINERFDHIEIEIR